MEVTGSTRLEELIKEHPHLLDFLVGRSPVFEKLKNPVLRKTIGKVATLSQVAAKAGLEVEKLVAEIAVEISAAQAAAREAKGA